jgi:glutathione-independent formaldehyde dehydrogenase
MMALLNDRLPIAKIVNAKAIRLEDAPEGYAELSKPELVSALVPSSGLVEPAASLS